MNDLTLDKKQTKLLKDLSKYSEKISKFEYYVSGNKLYVIISNGAVALTFNLDKDYQDGVYETKKLPTLSYTSKLSDIAKQRINALNTKIIPSIKQNSIKFNPINNDINITITYLLRNMNLKYTYNIQLLYTLLEYDFKDSHSTYYYNPSDYNSNFLIENSDYKFILGPYVYDLPTSQQNSC